MVRPMEAAGAAGEDMTTEQLDDVIARLRWLYHQAETAYRAGVLDMTVLMHALALATSEIERARAALERIEHDNV